jgi:hypothetical protein
MDDRMIDLVAGDARLRRRIDAYADARLTPDLVSTSRMRARVLAVAHRQADLARADAAALTVVPRTARPGVIATEARTVRTRRSARSRMRRSMTALLAAALILAVAAGTAFAARPGGALYEQRVWIETLTLPNEPSARAIAELARLEVRLQEAEDAARAGDSAGTVAALAAYARIVEAASEAAIATQDEVAVAILDAGVGRNVEVLQALALRVPDGASDAISRAVQRAVDRAVDRSDRAIERIETAGPANGGNGGSGSGGSGTGGSGAGPDKPADPSAKPTKAPTAAPTPKPTKEPNAGPTDPGATGGQGGQNGPKNTPKPQPTPKRTPRN